MKRTDLLVSDISCGVTALLFVVGLCVLGVRLREVQVDSSADYSYANARQSLRRVQTSGGRGRILDRHGVALAENRKSLSVVCHPTVFQRRTWDGTVAAIAEAVSNAAVVVGRPSPLTGREIRRHVNQRLAMPLVVWRDVGFDVLARFSEHEGELPGFSCQETEERVYPKGRLAAHLLGYVGRDYAEGQSGDEKFNFFCPELCGRAGLELYYDSYLRGVPGERRVTVDARGFAIQEWTVTEEKAGPDLTLTLDAALQAVVERELVGWRGACVVLDPRDGAVLALASAPTFDPNAFVPSLSRELYEELAGSPEKPLLNRAVGGAYAPGSTFKPVTALAGLTAGIPADHVYVCTGVFPYGGMRLRCARRWGHGEMDVRTALKESCNPFFCDMGVDIGTNALVSAARALGLGAKTGLDFGTDQPGVVPDAEWKRRVYHEPWYPGDVAQMSIGQGMLLASPLQMACVAGAIGTGFLVTPRLNAALPVTRRPLPFPAANLQVVREGMRQVVDGGSGRRGGQGLTVAVSGKTGTAEVGVGERRRKNTWFIAYAPSEAPVVAVAMVLENGESGGGTTAPRVRNVLAAFFGEK